MPTSRLRLPGPLLVLVACTWLGGNFLASYLEIPPVSYLLFLCIALLLLVLYWPHQTVRVSLLLLLCSLGGAWRYTQSLPGNDPHSILPWIHASTVEIQGVVSDEPKALGQTRTLHVQARRIKSSNSGRWYEADGDIVLQTLGKGIEDPYGANYGDSISIKGKLQPPPPHSSVTILGSMVFPHVQVLQPAGGPLALLFHLRTVLALLIEHALPQPEAATLIAILLSLKTASLQPLIPAFNITGTAHLIAPSGFKVTILAGLVSSIAQRLLPASGSIAGLPAERRGGWRGYLSTFFVLLAILLYTLLSGAGAAAIRAGIMGSLLVLAPRLGRQYHIYTALAFTALLMSIYDPLILWDAGFQLSFSGTLGIVVLTPFFQSLLHLFPPFRPLSHLPGGATLIEVIAVTLAAQTATLPFFIADFQQVSFIAPLANLLTVPLLGSFILLGSLLCIWGLLLGSTTALIGWLAYPLLWYTIHAILFCAHLPGAYLALSSIDNVLSITYYACLLLLVYYLQGKRHILDRQRADEHEVSLPPRLSNWLRLYTALSILLVTGAGTLIAHVTTPLSIRFFSVGSSGKAPSGEAVLLQTPDGKSMLIDGGPDAASLAQVLDSSLPSWQRSLDVVLLTTPRSEHLTGLLDVIDRYQIGTIMDAGMLHPSTTYARWRRSIDEKRIRYVSIQQGMQFLLGKDVTVQVLWPESTLHKGTNELRDNALILRVITPWMHILFLGAAAESDFALQGLLASVNESSMQAEVVQVEGEESARFAPLLQQVLAKTHPTLLVETPAMASTHQKKLQVPGTGAPSPSLSLPGGDQSMQTRSFGSLEIIGSAQGIAFSHMEDG